jgi:hypothetical protein
MRYNVTAYRLVSVLGKAHTLQRKRKDEKKVKEKMRKGWIQKVSLGKNGKHKKREIHTNEEIRKGRQHSHELLETK